ncbi:hypothetical protein [Actinomadura sp. SCN-SB]|uniref:hypothetical protein n=1 Tax=Actinomadura sp. SCN-SB TaxID=3373092 RepID=UPI00375315D5
MTLDSPTRSTARPGPFGARLVAVLRGIWRVIQLALSALGVLVTAVTGIPPTMPTHIAHLIADEYRAGRAGAIDADVIEDEEEPHR